VPAAAAKTQSASRSSAVMMRRLASPHSISTAATRPIGQKKISRQRLLQALFLAFLCAWFSVKPATLFIRTLSGVTRNYHGSWSCLSASVKLPSKLQTTSLNTFWRGDPRFGSSFVQPIKGV
jgi:hypothetical protein